jgi:protocatechuate 3,4-dioxygenase beta subunit
VTPLLFLFLLSAQQTNPPEDCSISGTATDSVTGAPLNKVQVLAEPADRNLPSASTVTDEKGSFSLVHLQPGEYRLKGARNGYLQTYYGARRAGGRGIMLTLSAGAEQKGLQIKLLPFAVIAGTVRDPEGEPLAEARVALIAVSYRNGVRQLRATGQYAATDDLGQYRIPSVAPGSYYVRAGPEKLDDWRSPVDHSPKDAPAPKTLVPTFCPAAAEIAGTQKIEVAAGDRFTGADVTLVRSRLFRVRVIFEAPPGIDSGIGLHPRPELGDGLGPDPPSDCKAHVCEFSAVPNGSYWAVGSAEPLNMTIDEMFSNSVQTEVSVPVDVNDADVDGVRVVIAAPAEIAGRVTVAGGEHADIKDARVRFVDADGREHDARVSSDGSFTARLSQGRYEVDARAGGDLIPESIHSEETDVLQEGLTVARSGKLPLEIVLGHNGAGIDGAVQDKDDQAVAGATVVLIPEAKLRFRHDLYQQTSTDQFGRYRFRSVTPGDYKLFVWADVEEGIWFDAEFLKNAEEQGHPVTIDPKGHAIANLRWGML